SFLSCLILYCITASSILLGWGSHKCCTKYDQIRPPIKALKSYVVQEITELCVIQTKPLCADPDRPWVKRAMEVVPQYDLSPHSKPAL
uniref:Chemokine interleukin-8-like domain-containing protein n=1 Tax=Periophthalmus magnuspinnatus TaxID=409849 RepID=A0A3B4AMV0_9GOBI